MEDILNQISLLQVFNQFWLSLFLLIPLLLVARTVVAVVANKYSPILFVVIFGLGMGYILSSSGVASPGMPEFQIIDIISKSTIIPLTCSFFLGGQELRKVFGKIHVEPCKMVIASKDEVVAGTTRTQLVYIFRAFFLLLGLETAFRLIVGLQISKIHENYSILAYIGLFCSIIIIDYTATIQNEKLYIKKGFLEIVILISILVATYYITVLIKPLIALPQIFFAMVITASLGAVFYKWRFGPTIKSLLFTGLPLVLAANFLIGGSRISEAFNIKGLGSVLSFGFFGQITWMFGGIALLMIFAKTNHIRNLAPGMAGGLSHAGLTGACSAGDFGKTAELRTPIMINMPFIAHVFVFSILAVSAANNSLTIIPALCVLIVGFILTAVALRIIKKSNEDEGIEIKGLMLFSLGWQLVAMFGSFIILSVFGMSLNHVAVSATSALSHFGLFAATQGGLFGVEVIDLLPFIFAMPFLVHPFLFFIFGQAMKKDGYMPKIPVFILTGIGIIGIIYSVISI